MSVTILDRPFDESCFCYTIPAMTYDGLVLAAVVAELNKAIVGGRVQKIRQHSATDITLDVRAPGRTHLLFLSVDARSPRLYLTSASEAVPQQAPSFCMVLRKYIEGAFVAAVDQVGFDRVMRLRTVRHGEPERVLILEIMGKHSNLILADEAGRILGAAKHIGASVSRYRQILPGREYLPPPGSDKLDLRDLDAAAIESALRTAFAAPAQPAAAREWLVANLSGFGPFLANEVVARAAADGAVDATRLRDELLRLADTVRRSSYDPVFITDETGRGLMVYPIPSVQFPASQQHLRDSINEPLDALFRSLVTRTLLDDERGQTLTAIRRAAASRQQAMKSIDRTIAESARADRYRQIGDLLLPSLHTLTKGDRTARLIDYFDPEMPEIEIELDEKLTPQQNAERYFRRYQKARDAASTAEARKNKIARELAALESAKQEAESAAAVDELRDMRKTLTAQDLLRREARAEGAVDEFAGYRIGRVWTPEGWEILYGETSQANDYLTRRIARPDDVWLHARSITGAHVVIRTRGHSAGVPRQVLIQAALVAARNSQAKHSSLVPVDHTLRKHVRKPRGSAPGFVTYKNEKTLDVSPMA